MNRFRLIVWTFILGVGLCCLYILHLLHYQTYFTQKGDQQSIRQTKYQNNRPIIKDRNGFILAGNAPSQSLVMDPRYVKPNKNLKRLFEILSLSDQKQQQIKQAIHKKSTRAIELARHVFPNQIKKIQRLNIQGLKWHRNAHRFYPKGPVTGAVLGLTDIDNQPISGFEMRLSDHLGWMSKSSIIRYHQNQIGKIAFLLDSYPAELDTTRSVHLTLDHRVQFIAYQALKSGVKQASAKSGQVIVMNAKTGGILAMANYPSFNPNTRQWQQFSFLRNRTITDVLEPGSVIKPFAAMAALQSSQDTPETIYDTSPGILRVGNDQVKDFRNYGKLSLKEIIARSSNVGVSKAILANKTQNKTLFPDMLRKLGFSHQTGIELPGERHGSVPWEIKRDFDLATLSFGYGLTATPLQIAKAYGIIANHGQTVSPHIILNHSIRQHLSMQQVIQANLADDVIELLKATVAKPYGTGRRANVSGSQVAGKTGTSFKVGPKGYDENKRYALFAGFAPADHASIVIVIVIDEPKNPDKNTGGSAAAPVFHEISKDVLPMLGIHPLKKVTES